MGWQDRVVKGQFRGVPFIFDETDVDLQRRIISHQFPQRDEVLHEDLGAEPGKFPIEAQLIGDDYLEQLDLLYEACTKSGPGVLVHPFYGTINARCVGIKTKYKRTEARTVGVSLTFLKEDLTPALITTVDTAIKSKQASAKLTNEQEASFSKSFDYTSQPYNKANSIVDMLNAAIDAVELAQEEVNKYANFAKQLSDIRGLLSLLVLDSSKLASSIINLITYGFVRNNDGLVIDAIRSFQHFSRLFDFSPIVDSPSDTTDSIIHLIQTVAVTNAAHMLAVAKLDSADQAREMRNKLFGAIDALQISGIDKDLFISLLDLRKSVELDIDKRIITLPVLSEVTPVENTNTLALTYSLYGKLTQEQGIISRNNIEHPGFLLSSVPIKVLVNA